MLIALLYLFMGRWQLQHPLDGTSSSSAWMRRPDLLGLPGVVRSQDPDVPGAYLVAGYPRWKRHRRFHRALTAIGLNWVPHGFLRFSCRLP